MNSASDTDLEILKLARVYYSRGQGLGGKLHAFIIPNSDKCTNMRYRVGGWDRAELNERILACIIKHYSPQLLTYRVDNHIVCSNNETSALKEYWRICDRAKIKKPFSVELITNPETLPNRWKDN